MAFSQMGTGLSFILLLLCVFPSSAYPQQLPIEKGPILHFNQDRLQVRFQAKKLKKPVVQWRDQNNKRSMPMKADDRHFWEADLNAVQGEYRIVEGDQSTPWYPILNQKNGKEDFKFTVYGETLSGQGLGSGRGVIHQHLIQQMKKENPSLVLHTGNLVFLGGHSAPWGYFLAESKDLIHSVPFQPTLGPSDRSKTEQYIDYYDVDDHDNTFYEFQYGPAHFIALDTTRRFSPGSSQYIFLTETLEKLRGHSPIIVYFNHPPFSSSVAGSDLKVRENLVPLFEKYGVDLVLSGGDHNYQRIGPINGVTYIVTGGGGGGLTKVIDHPEIKQFKSLYHYLVFTVDGNLIRGKMKDPRGIVEDQFEIQHQANPIGESERKPLPEIKGSKRYQHPILSR